MSTVITQAKKNTSVQRLALLTWILVAVFYFYLSWGYIRVTMDDQEFGDYLQYLVNVAGSEARPNREIRALILVRADQLSLPVRRDQIEILGNAQTLNVRVNYSVDVELPVFQRRVYVKEFSHDVQYRVNR